MLSSPLLAEDNRATRSTADRQSDHSQRRQANEQRGNDTEEIEAPFEDRITPAAYAVSTPFRLSGGEGGVGGLGFPYDLKGGE